MTKQVSILSLVGRGQYSCNLWCVVTMWAHNTQMIGGSCLCHLGFNEVLTVTKLTIKTGILCELSLALTMLNCSKCALSFPQAITMTTMATLCSTWTHELVVNWSDECLSADARHILCLSHSDIATATATILPVQAVLWWKSDMSGVLDANWEAPSELAVVAD